MKIGMRIGAVDDMECTISITMKVSQWRDIVRQLPTQYPSWKLGSGIADALGHVTRATEAQFEWDDKA